MSEQDLSQLKQDALNALSPHNNREGDWKAIPQGRGPEWAVCGPKRASRPTRPVLADVHIDGITDEDANTRSAAIAKYMVACINADPTQLRAQRDELLNVLVEALPYVEMAEHDEAYRPGAVKQMASKMRKAIAHASPEPASK